MKHRGTKVVAAALMGALFGAPLAPADEEGFRPLQNGKDLSGWVNVNTHATTWQVRDGVIVCSGKPIGELRTDRQYENFVLELEWRHMKPGGNAGLFVWADDLPARGVPFIRGIEVQILDGRNSENSTSHGDVFAIHGATMTPDRPHPAGWARCLPSEHRSKPAGQWNHYRVVCDDGTIKLAVNGKIVSGGSECSPRKGYICLESEGSEAHFRNIRIKELPSSNPSAEMVATSDRGFRPLFGGLDLSGWRADKGHQGHWAADDWRLRYDGQSAAPDKGLWTSDSFGEFQLIVDWRWAAGPKRRTVPVVFAGGELHTKEIDARVRAWHRTEITRSGDGLTVKVDGETVLRKQLPAGKPVRGRVGLADQGVPVEFANVFIRSLDEQRQ